MKSPSEAVVQVLLKPKFAELLLPHVMLDLAVCASQEDTELRFVLSSNLSDHILNDPDCERKAVGLILEALNHLRSFYLDTIDSTNTQGKSSKLHLLKEFHEQGQFWSKVRRCS